MNTNFMSDFLFSALLDGCNNSDECDLIFEFFGLDFNQLYNY